MMPFRLILASGSRYRASQLSQLGLAFEIIPASVDESPIAGETPAATALRLAKAKAQTVANSYPDAFVLGCDQTADCDGQLLGKPGSFELACAQLEQMSGKTVRFHSALCLATPPGLHYLVNVPTEVRFLRLESAQIASYIRKEQPLDCAGSFKVEGLGIALFEWIRSDDPSALIGLPLIALTALLRQQGFDVLTA